MTIDPVTTEVVASRLREIASTMEYALYHAGYSPILRESKDGTAGLVDVDGRVVIISGGLQYHSLPYEKAVSSVKARYPVETMKPGDSYLVNDPYQGGNPHVPDMIVVTPAFHDGTLIGYGASIAHKADVGGLVPGSSGAAAREIYHDGLLLPPVKYMTADGVNEIVEAIIRSNSRVPDVVLGDLRGQAGCTRIGAERLAHLCDEYGRDTVLAVMRSVIALTAQRTRAEIATWADGVGRSEGFLDHDGAVLDKPVRIAVTVTKTGDKLVIDFSGCSPQTAGPVNVNTHTARAVSLLAVLASSDPGIPMNSGTAEAVEFVIPEGLVVSPRHPATINHYFPTSHLVYNCVLSALGQINPKRAVAPSGLGCGAIAIGYEQARSGKRAVQYEIVITGLGGTSRQDGATIVQPMNHITPGAPVEIVESEYPVRVRRFDLWTDSAGAGTYRGGLGYVRDYELLTDCIFTARTANHRFAAWGEAGGQSPRTSRTTINPDRPDRESLGPIESRRLKAGDVLRLERSGGAGYGDPLERDPLSVLDDVRNGYVTLPAAADSYGVVVAIEDLTLDIEATKARRFTMRAKP
jgi:N-methylhydantoinase B